MADIQKAEEEQGLIMERIEQMREHAPDAADLMKALGSESRLMILCTLAEGDALEVVTLVGGG